MNNPKSWSLIIRWLPYLSLDEYHWSKFDLRKQVWSSSANLAVLVETEREIHTGTIQSACKSRNATRGVWSSLVNPRRRSRNLDGLRTLRCYFTMRREGEHVKGHPSQLPKSENVNLSHLILCVLMINF